jgi:hypothetical protein
MELGSYFLFLQEQINDIIITFLQPRWRMRANALQARLALLERHVDKTQIDVMFIMYLFKN